MTAGESHAVAAERRGGLRLLVLSSLYPPAVRGGYEVECRDVVEHLRERHDVTVLTSRLGREPAREESHVLRLLPWVGELRKRDAALASIHAWRARRVVTRVLARVQPDAIYVWNGGGVPGVTFRALQRAELPVLVRVCEYWFTMLYERDAYTRYLPGGTHVAGRVRGAEAAWGIATRLANRLPGLRVETQQPLPASVCWNSLFVQERAPAPPGVAVRHRAVVVPATARTEELRTVERAPRPGRVLFVGRLDRRKGAATLVRAVAALKSRGVAAELAAVGPGSSGERAELEALAERLGVADRVRLRGPLDGQRLRAEISAAAVWCVPSEWEEPAPLVCVEAALARVPAVLSRVGGIPELLAEGREALFHAPGDDAACADAIASCLEGGPQVDARVQAALVRAQAYRFEPYLAAMDAFLDEGLAKLGWSSPPAAT